MTYLLSCSAAFLGEQPPTHRSSVVPSADPSSFCRWLPSLPSQFAMQGLHAALGGHRQVGALLGTVLVGCLVGTGAHAGCTGARTGCTGRARWVHWNMHWAHWAHWEGTLGAREHAMGTLASAISTMDHTLALLLHALGALGAEACSAQRFGQGGGTGGRVCALAWVAPAWKMLINALGLSLGKKSPG